MTLFCSTWNSQHFQSISIKQGDSICTKVKWWVKVYLDRMGKNGNCCFSSVYRQIIHVTFIREVKRSLITGLTRLQVLVRGRVSGHQASKTSLSIYRHFNYAVSNLDSPLVFTTSYFSYPLHPNFSHFPDCCQSLPTAKLKTKISHTRQNSLLITQLCLCLSLCFPRLWRWSILLDFPKYIGILCPSL